MFKKVDSQSPSTIHYRGASKKTSVGSLPVRPAPRPKTSKTFTAKVEKDDSSSIGKVAKTLLLGYLAMSAPRGTRADEIITTSPFAYDTNPGQIRSCNSIQIAPTEVVTVCEEGPATHSTLTHLHWNGTEFSVAGSPVTLPGQAHPQVFNFQNGGYGVVSRIGNNLTFTQRDQNDQILGQANWAWINTTNNYPMNGRFAPSSYPRAAKLNATRAVSVHTVMNSAGNQFDVVGLVYDKGLPPGLFRSWFCFSCMLGGNSSGPSLVPFSDGSYVLPWITDQRVVAGHYDINSNELNHFTIAANGSCPRGSVLPDGTYVVAWLNEDIFLQRFTANDTAVGTPIKVNTTPINVVCKDQEQVLDVVVAGDGLTVSWIGAPNATALPKTLYFQRLNFTGALEGGEEVVTTNSNSTTWPALTQFQTGMGWLHSWVSSGSTAFLQLFQFLPVTPSGLTPTSTSSAAPTTATTTSLPTTTAATTTSAPTTSTGTTTTVPTTTATGTTSDVPTTATSSTAPTTVIPATTTAAPTAPLESENTTLMNILVGVGTGLAALCASLTSIVIGYWYKKRHVENQEDPESQSISGRSTPVNYQSIMMTTNPAGPHQYANVSSVTPEGAGSTSKQYANVPVTAKAAAQYQTPKLPVQGSHYENAKQHEYANIPNVPTEGPVASSEGTKTEKSQYVSAEILFAKPPASHYENLDEIDLKGARTIYDTFEPQKEAPSDDEEATKKRK